MASLFPALVLALAPGPRATAADRPNILVVQFDDLGYSDLGCYGGKIDAPNLDSLAEGGVLFESIYPAARCCPSRVALMTGLHPPRTGVASLTMQEPHSTRSPAYFGCLNDRCVALGEMFGDSGYSCYDVGKWHLHNETGPIQRGFDEFFRYTLDHSHDRWDADFHKCLPAGRKKKIDRPQGEFYSADVFSECAIEFIQKGRQRGRPWFVFLGHSSPHFSVQAEKGLNLRPPS